MLALFAKALLKIMGWRITGVIPPGTKKCIIAVAPHTSYWDFVIGRLAYWVMGIKASFLIKKEVFRFPFKFLLLSMGGIPVDRGRSSKMVEQVAEQFRKADSLYIVITPEGTRKPVRNWKKGFYYIAMQAQVPIALGYLDYARKEGGVGKVIFPNGDYDSQLKEIKEFYRSMTPKHPEKFILGD
ncbi:MAG: lysophospholipid acyltransferase family protein [Bacteroidales bacterium]|nr:lysophospholipid acyltransferase family protein [Bacteroidales bacterium]